MEDITREMVEIDGVMFHFHKMKAMQGWRVFEKIRQSIATVDIGDPENIGKSIAVGIKALASLPIEFIDDLRADLFKHITFRSRKTEGNSQPEQQLHGLEDMALEGVKPIAIYELIVRSLAVNFTESFSGLVSHFPALKTMDLSLLKQ